MSNQTPFQPPDIPPKLFTLPKVRAYALELCGITPFQAVGLLTLPVPSPPCIAGARASS